MKQQNCTVAWMLLGTFIVGCAAGNHGASATVNPIHVSGSISPRNGLAIPEGTRIEIVASRRDYPDSIVTVQPLAPALSWPASYDIPVMWPNVPKQGEQVTWKFGPPELEVHARGSVDGQLTFISSSK